METIHTVISISLLVVAITSNALVLQSTLHGAFQRRRQNCSLRQPGSNYRRYLISLLASNIYVCAANALILTFLTLSEHLDANVPESLFLIVQRIALVGFLANLLNFCVISVDHFTQVVYPHAYKLFSKRSSASIAIGVIWAMALLAGFGEYPVRTVQIMSKADSILACSHYEPQIVSLQKEKSTFLNDNIRVVGKFKGGTTPAPKVFMGRHYRRKTTKSKKNGRMLVTRSASTFPDDVKMEVTLPTTMTPPRSDGCFNASGQQDYVGPVIDLIDEIMAGSPAYKLWLDCATLLLAMVIMIILIVLCVRTVQKTNRVMSKKRLRRAMVTAMLLLGFYIACWLPLITYDMVLVLPAILESKDEDGFNDSNQFLSAAVDAAIHPICLMLFMASPITPPVIFICRNHRVQKYLVERYQVIIPARICSRLLAATPPSVEMTSNSTRQNNSNPEGVNSRAPLHSDKSAMVTSLSEKQFIMM